MALVIEDDRHGALLRRAVHLEGVTLAWMVIEAAVSIGAGVVSGSLLLAAFGIDSLVELISAAVLLQRLWGEAHLASVRASTWEHRERRAASIAGWLLFALAAYVLAQSIYGLVVGARAETSLVGIAVAVVAAVGMPVLARVKLRLADQIASPALRADAVETLTCAYLSWVLLGGLLANALLHWWWLDGAASLLIIPFLVKEGREAVTGRCTCHSADD
jgi:divalent metal cation (Fe/Co/Zn/Cd) transporter